MNRADPDAKDELAQLTKTWAKGERGEEIPSRLVLSGHSVGDGVWGDHNGEIYRRDIADLAKAMPRAAAQVEDLHISGCYSGGQGDVDSWRGIFPAKTVWAYTARRRQLLQRVTTTSPVGTSYCGDAPTLIETSHGT